jgi:transglutaminase-like putative cysteine protease
MQNSIIFKSLFFMFAISLTMTSCSPEENIEQITEITEDIPLQSFMALTISGETTEYDAFATYCINEATGQEFLQISNDLELIEEEVSSISFDGGDFVIYQALTNGETEVSFAGAAFSEDINGTTVSFSEQPVVIDEITDTYVVGSMDGTFELFSGDIVNYSVSFVAEIIGTSPYCE